MPVHAVLKNANARDVHTACGLYTLAAHCPGALCALVMHKSFWGSGLWDPDCGFGEPTKFRGAPIIDDARLLAPLSRDELYLSSPPRITGGEGKRARITVDMGFKMSCAMDRDASAAASAAPAGETMMMVEDDGDSMGVQQLQQATPVMADVAILPRAITALETLPYGLSSDMRIAPFGCIDMEVQSTHLVMCPRCARTCG